MESRGNKCRQRETCRRYPVPLFLLQRRNATAGSLVNAFLRGPLFRRAATLAGDSDESA